MFFAGGQDIIKIGYNFIIHKEGEFMVIAETLKIPLIWFFLMILFAGVEAATMGLTTIWFAVGALAAMICSLVGVPLVVQIVVFTLVSLIMLIFTRRILVERLHTGREKTNVETMAGRTGLVIEDVSAFQGGRVKVAGQEWAARLLNGDESLIIGTKVKVIKVEGVTLIVIPEEKERF